MKIALSCISTFIAGLLVMSAYFQLRFEEFYPYLVNPHTCYAMIDVACIIVIVVIGVNAYIGNNYRGKK